jgi:hypothetical protein
MPKSEFCDNCLLVAGDESRLQVTQEFRVLNGTKTLKYKAGLICGVGEVEGDSLITHLYLIHPEINLLDTEKARLCLSSIKYNVRNEGYIGEFE